MTSYTGGKGGEGVYHAIINQMPPHDVYIEPFLGSGAVMRHKLPAAVNIGIDLDPAPCSTANSGARATEIICADAIAWLAGRRGWTGRELIYCDPPYLASARRYPGRRRYAHELGDAADHRRLLDVLTRLPCMVMVSGYPASLYLEALAGWRLVMFGAATRGRPALEYLWCNFPAPKALHDCRYLGDGFRERERIKRKAARWRARFAALDPLERQAVLSVCLQPDEVEIAPRQKWR